MNVLIVNANDNSLGGASRVAMDLHDGLISAAIQSNVVVGKKTTSSKYVWEIPRPHWRKVTSRLMANDFEFFASDKIFDIEQYKKADIVHFHNLNGWYFNLKTLEKISLEKPVVWTLHDMWPINPHSGYTSSRRKEHDLFKVSDPSLYPRTLWNNDKYLSLKKNLIYQSSKLNLVSPSNWLKKLTLETSLGKKSASFAVIPNGIDADIFKMASDKNKLRKELFLSYSPIVLFVGAAAPTNKFKGFDDFLWLSQQPQNANIQFVCIGSRENKIIGNMRYIKATSNKEIIANYLSAADVFILTSKFENFPLVILESLSCGTPVISYDVGGVSEILSELKGCSLVPLGDKLSLLSSLTDLLKFNVNTFDQQNSTFLRSVVLSKYSKTIMVNKYINLYKSLI